MIKFCRSHHVFDVRQVYFEKIRVLKVCLCLHICAWNNKIRLRFYFVEFQNWGNDLKSLSLAKSEILRSLLDKLLRNHLPRMFSLIENEM